MNKKTAIVIGLAVGLLSVAHDNFYTRSMLAGVYVYNFPDEIAEGPSFGDHFLLKESGRFESNTWSKGTYSIERSRIHLTSDGKTGGFASTIYRPWFWGKPRIHVVKDLNYYFKKIE